MTGTAKVHDLYRTALWVAEQNVFRLEVAVDDVQFRRRKEHQRHAQLLRKLARQVQGHAAEVGVAQQVVEVVREQLKDETQVGTEHEVTLQPHYNVNHLAMSSVRIGTGLTIKLARLKPLARLKH